MLLRNPGSLRPIYHIEEFTVPEEGVDIVVVPGVWIEYPPDRFKNNCSWIKPLAASMPIDTRVFLFSYQLEIDGSSLWDQLLGQSVALIKGLDLSRADSGFEQRPLLFICHSLGGLIVKRALTLASRSRQSYEDVTSGIIFLGSPHLTSASASGWNNVKLIMKGNRKDISKQNMTDNEMEMIIKACRQFEDLQLTVPILSIYELRETKVRENLFHALQPRSKPAAMLISRAMAQIDAPRESLFEVDKNHVELPQVDVNSPLYIRLTEFFSAFAHYAPTNTKLVFRQIPNHGFEKSNLRTKSSISSFPGTSSYTPQNTTEHTPGTEGSSKNVLPTHGEAQQHTGTHTDPQPIEGVQLPFSHISSISRNQAFHGQGDVLDKIDYAFGLQCPAGIEGEQTRDQDGDLCKPKSYVLCGMGGIGKTETAIEYLYSRGGQFDAVLWIYADTTRKLGAQFAILAKELGKEAASDGMDEVSAREVVKAWLAAPVGYHKKDGKIEKVDITWLMVFDNADDPDILYDWLPAQGPGCILVTSRYPYIRENIYRLGDGLELEPFSPEVGGEMLRKLSERQQEADATETSVRIVKLLGGLPLAIAQMSGIIRQKHLTLRDFEEWYREDSKDLHGLKFSGMQSNYQYTVGTAWAVEQLSASAFALLNLLSVLDPDRIPEELLMDGVKEVELPDYPIKKNEYFNARAELIHASLVTRNMATNELRIHRLIQDVVRHRMKESELRAVFAAVAVLLSAVWPYVCGTDPTRNQSWRIPLAEKHTPHICRLEALFGLDIREGKYDGTATSGYVFCSYAWYIFERGLPDQTEIFASLAQIILDRALEMEGSKDERVTHWLGEAHHNLSLAAVLTGSSDGMDNANIWINILLDRIKRFNLPSEALSLATAYNQVGICHINKDEVEDAMKSFKQSLSAYRNVEGRPKFSGTWPSISLALLCTLQGQPEEGEKVLTPTLEEHEEILGEDDATTTECGHIWRAMGNIRNAQQRYGEALRYHQRAMENMKVTLGTMHYFTGDCFYSLGEDWARQGENAKARENLDAAITAFTAAPHREAQAARAMWKKGCLLKDAGNDVEKLESERLFREAMKIRHDLVPNDKFKVEELHDKDWADLIFYWSR